MSKSRAIDGKFSWLPPPLTVMAVSPKGTRRHRVADLCSSEDKSYIHPPTVCSRPGGSARETTERVRRTKEESRDDLAPSRNRSQTVDDRSERKIMTRPRSATSHPDGAMDRAVDLVRDRTANGRSDKRRDRVQEKDNRSDQGRDQGTERGRRNGQDRDRAIIERDIRTDKGRERVTPRDSETGKDRVTKKDRGTERDRESEPTAEQQQNEIINDRVSGKKESVIINEHVGRKEVNLERVFASRKISQLNPSPKFLTLSYQRDSIDANDNPSLDDGAMYARRINQSNEGNNEDSSRLPEGKQAAKDQRRSSKNKSKKKKAAKKLDAVNEESKNDQVVTGRKTEASNPGDGVIDIDRKDSNVVDDTARTNNRALKKKSVFEMREIEDDEQVDVSEVMKRKPSDPNYEKIVSVSYEAERVRKNNVLSPQTQKRNRGGMYAKKVARKPDQQGSPRARTT